MANTTFLEAHSELLYNRLIKGDSRVGYSLYSKLCYCLQSQAVLAPIVYNKYMKNERNPEIGNGQNGPKKLANFAKSLARNEEGVYEYILLMVQGDFRAQENAADCIFTHLRNVMSSETSTNVLKYASRVEMV